MILFWQIFLGIILIVSRIAGKYTTGSAFILIVWWTIGQTSGELTLFQITVQGIIATVLILIPQKTIEQLYDSENEKLSIFFGGFIFIAFFLFGNLCLFVLTSYLCLLTPYFRICFYTLSDQGFVVF